MSIRESETTVTILVHQAVSLKIKAQDKAGKNAGLFSDMIQTLYYISPVSSSFLWKKFIMRMRGFRNTVPNRRNTGR